MTDHEQSLDILDSLAQILANVPGVLKEHQQRINSVDYLRERLNKLAEFERAATLDLEGYTLDELGAVKE